MYMKEPEAWEQHKSWNSHIDFDSTEARIPKRAFGSEGHEEDHAATYPPSAYPPAAYPPSKLIQTWDLQRYRIPKDWKPQWKAPASSSVHTSADGRDMSEVGTYGKPASSGAETRMLNSRIEHGPMNAGASLEKDVVPVVQTNPTTDDTVIRNGDLEPKSKNVTSTTTEAGMGNKSVDTELPDNQHDIPSSSIARSTPNIKPETNVASESLPEAMEDKNAVKPAHVSVTGEVRQSKVTRSAPTNPPKTIEGAKPVSDPSTNKKAPNNKGLRHWTEGPATQSADSVPSSGPSSAKTAKPTDATTMNKKNRH